MASPGPLSNGMPRGSTAAWRGSCARAGWRPSATTGTGALRRVYCTDQPDTSRVPGQPPLFFREIEQDGRLYVFARQRTLESWAESGELGNQASTHIGAGPNGETVVFDSDDARVLYAQRRGLEAPALPPGGPIPGPANLRVATLGDQLVAASPKSRVVSLSGKDRGFSPLP